MVVAAAGAAVGLGILLIVVGARRTHEPSTASSTGLWTSARRRWTALPRGRRRWIAVSMVLGVAVTILSGWPLAMLLVPGALLGLPALLSAPPNREIDVLAALDRWVRLIATSLSSGRSVRDAIFATRRQVSPVLREPVARLCTRMDQRWQTRDALFAMADELESADADAVVAALAIAAAKGGAGARTTLGAVSDSIQSRLAALREVAAERAKPRVVVRQVTFITLGVLIGAVALNPQFFVPYTTPLGQAIALVLVAVYVGCLAVLRKMTIPPSAPRFLRSRA